MDYSICRLCLNVTYDNKGKLSEDNSIVCKIRSCLCLDLTFNESLPNWLCKECKDKLEELNEFSRKVKENDQILKQHIHNGTIWDYYNSLTSNTDIKKEVGASTLKHENINDEITPKEIREKSNTPENNVTVDTIIINEAYNTEQIVDTTEVDHDIHGTASSDDEDNRTLSTLREEKSDNNQENTPNPQYNCFTCNKMCTSHDELRDHYKTEHTNKDNKIIETKYTEIISNGKVTYKCDICKKIYAKKHMKRHTFYHTNERPYICKLCGRTYKTVSDIMRHGARVHGGLKLHCSFKCGFSTAYTGALKEHEDRIHKNVYKYTCEKCGKGFRVKTWYEQHQNIHTGLKPFVCEICGVAFHMDKYLTSHRSTLHPQSLSEKRLICIHCDLKCDSVNSLALHLETEHGIKRAKGKCMKKKCLCDFCGKILNRPEQLVFHRRMHLGEKPYQCSTCHKCFTRPSSLRVHTLSHSVSKAWVCTLCGMRYSQRSALYRHQRLQHGLPRKRTW